MGIFIAAFQSVAMKFFIFSLLVLGALAQTAVEEKQEKTTDEKLTDLEKNLDKIGGHIGRGVDATSKWIDETLRDLGKKGGAILDKFWEGLEDLVVGKKGELSEDEQFIQEVIQMYKEELERKIEMAQEVTEWAVGVMQEVIKEVYDIDFITKDPEEAQKKVEETAEAHARFTRDLFSDFTVTPAKQQNKRVIDAIKSIGKTLGDAFKPHIDKIVDGVNGIVKQVTGEGKDLWEKAKPHVDKVLPKLDGHLKELGEHGKEILRHAKNGLDALIEASTDILNETLQKMKPSIDKAVDVIVDGAGVVKDHVLKELARGTDCKKPDGSIKSTNGKKVTVVFRNLAHKTLILHWVDYSGKMQGNWRVESGKSITMNTNTGHPWVVTDEQGVVYSLGGKCLYYP